MQSKIAFKISQPKNRQNEILQFSREIFSKTLSMIFLYFYPFVGRIVVSKIWKKFRKFNERIL